MSGISILEAQIEEYRRKIADLEREQDYLDSLRRENINAIDDVERQIARRYGMVEYYSGISKKTTLAAKLSGKVSECYGEPNKVKIITNYQSIGTEIQQTIFKIEQEIESYRDKIRGLQIQIEEIREEERREAERREADRREAEQRAAAQSAAAHRKVK